MSRGRGLGESGEPRMRSVSVDDRIMNERLEKIANTTLPYTSSKDHSIAQARALGEGLAEQEELEEAIITLAGRMLAKRKQGRICFADLNDQDSRIQLFVMRDILGVDDYAQFCSLDLGDIIEVKGHVMRTSRGELSLKAHSFKLLSKCLRPLPDKHNGLVDPEKRLAQRYLDLIANEGVRERFLTRSRIISSTRRFLEDRDFVEVETPLLQPIYGGAAARPFVSHHNEMDRDFYMRISPELYLKRLLVGGFERVYEIGKSLRNEGVSTTHNPEFTMVELYQAYVDYNSMMDLTEELIRHSALESNGHLDTTWRGHEIDLSKPFARKKYRDLVLEATGVDLKTADEVQLCQALTERGQTIEPGASWSDMADDLFGATVEPTLIQPTFVIDIPAKMSPLARVHREDPFAAERFELIIAGCELANAYSEQNDPIVQRQRMEELAAQSGEKLDEDYLTALEYAMPPAGGLGIGLDRMAMMLTGQDSIRETILFPARRQ